MSEKRDPAEAPQVGEPAASAAGPRAVGVVLREVTARSGLVRGARALGNANQRRGFDCPGCAWPEPERRKHAEFCENGAKAIADEATRKRVDAAFFARYSIDDLRLRSGRWLNEQGRLCEPVVLHAGASHYVPIEWDDAFRLIADEVALLDGPDAVAFYTSGRTSNEAAFLYQLLARRFGTNNLPDCSNMCHESSGTALKTTIGSGKGTVTLDDFARADAIFVVGQNPGSNHPRMLAALQEAKRRGARIVSINPLAETGLKRFRNPQEFSGWLGRGTALSDLWLRVRVNGDVALFKGLAKAMVDAEARSPGAVLDHAFIEASTEGFAAYRDDLQHTSWESIERESGVVRADIEQAAAIAIEAGSTLCCWAMGVTQHENAVANIQSIVNFLLLRGNFGRPGAGACPVRGHSNVQGDRTMGIWEKPDREFLRALEAEFDFTPPLAHGLDTVGTIHAMHDGAVQAFIALGGNFVAATPDAQYTEAALRRCRITVQISTKLNRSHVVTGRTALMLPALGRTDRDLQAGVEQFVTTENSMGVVSPSRGVLDPLDTQIMSEPRIVAGLAQALVGPDERIRWSWLADDYSRIRAHIARVVPGFERFNERLERAGQIELPHPVRDEAHFPTPSGRALFTVHPIESRTLPDGRYLMTTIRSHDQFNTTVYSLDDRYRGVRGGRRVVFMNPEDIAAAGLADGQRVDLTSHHGESRRTLRSFRLIRYDIPRGCVATYYPEANPLVPIGHVAAGSNTPAYKSVLVSLEPAAEGTC